MSKITLIISLIVALVLGILTYTQLFPTKVSTNELQKELQHAYLMQEKDKLGKTLTQASLIDNTGEEFTPQDFKGKWSLLFFGFTYCPDICITQLHLLSKIYKALEKEQFEKTTKAPLQVYFASVDPKRDSVEQLNNYVTYFNPTFKGVTGDVAQLKRFMKPFGAYYEFSYHHDGKHENVSIWEEIPEQYRKTYTVNHTGWSYLINPEAKLIASFPAPQDGEKMLADIKRIVKHFSTQ